MATTTAYQLSWASPYHDQMVEATTSLLTPLVHEFGAGVTPWQACRRLADRAHLLFLDSAQTSALGRYSFVSAEPIACTARNCESTSSLSKTPRMKRPTSSPSRSARCSQKLRPRWRSAARSSGR